jgi:hypothetical protein
MNTLLRYIILVFAAGYPTALFLQSTGAQMPEAETVMALYVALSLLLIVIHDYSRSVPKHTMATALRTPRWVPALNGRTRLSASAAAPQTGALLDTVLRS